MADWGSPFLNALDALNRCYCRRFHRLQGRIPLPPRGPAIVAANHLSGLDPALLIAASPRPLRFLIARDQYQRPLLRWLFHAMGCIPVERFHPHGLALREALKALERGEVVALFPEGGLHLHRVKPGVAWLARNAGCPIHPVRIEGVRGQGHIFWPYLLPGRVRVHPYPPLACGEEGACLKALARALFGD
ncbi:MAG: 1-acyl-sn-glycerol-3-phosphate acyltransferase [Gammaproteobacteria bacterium]|nr:MAG: 1-acyl-sn-glycerol-3-phosphate acyltransferase [Gammaproteobacteria bacterium]